MHRTVFGNRHIVISFRAFSQVESTVFMLVVSKIVSMFLKLKLSGHDFCLLYKNPPCQFIVGISYFLVAAKSLSRQPVNKPRQLVIAIV